MVGTGGQIGPPVRLLGQRRRHAGQPRQRTWRAGHVQSPVQDGRGIAGAVVFPHLERGSEGGNGVGADEGQQRQVTAQGGPRRRGGQPRGQPLGEIPQFFSGLVSEVVVGGEAERVGVAGGGRLQLLGRFDKCAAGAGGRGLGAVAGQHVGQQVGGG